MEKQTQKNFYAIIPAFVRYDNDLQPNAKLLYGEITALCNEKGFCWAENEYFATLYNVSKTSISKWISSLIKKQYITSEIIYKKGTREIEHRYLRIVGGGIEEKLNTPIEEKLKDNNTNNNTTNIIKENITKERSVETTKPTDDDLTHWFNQVYGLYPRKVSKVQAKRTFIKKLEGLDKDSAHKRAITIYRMLESQNTVWNGENNGQGRKVEHIPYFSSWLNSNVEDSEKRRRK